MGVKIKASYLVPPAEPTWHGVHPLSVLDTIGMVTHVHIIHFYSNVDHRDWPNPPDKILGIIKDSLSCALVPFYPLAGRLRRVDGGGKLELECNAKGVEFIEAESSQLMSDFGDFSSFKGFADLFPRVDYSKPIQDHPLCLVQLTWFRCGGFAFGTAVSHIVADGLGATHFVCEWARLARGDPLEASPCLDRRVLHARRKTLAEKSPNVLRHVDFFPPLPTLMGRGDNSKEQNKEIIAKVLTLTKSQVDMLKMAANRETQHDRDKRPYGRFEAVAAHIWRCACKARELAREQVTAFSFSIDIRRLLDPPLPLRYFGNATVVGVASCQVGELMSLRLSHACQKIREAKEKVTGDYVWSMIEFLEEQRRFPTSCQDQGSEVSIEDDFMMAGNPNVMVSSWLNLPVRGIDFGWGKEIYMAPATHDFDGDIVILPGYVEDGSVTVFVALQVTHMEKFKKSFYEDIEMFVGHS